MVKEKILTTCAITSVLFNFASERFLKIGKYHQASRESPLLDKVKPAIFAGKYYYTKKL